MNTSDVAGISVDRLAALDRMLSDQWVAAGRLPGFLLEVWRRGQRVHLGMGGMTDIARDRAMREDAIFRIYSMTKPIVGVALLRLMEEGRIALADEVADYLPQFRDLRVWTGGEDGTFATEPLRRPVRVIDLARYTSGIAGGYDTPVGRAYRRVHPDSMDTAGGLPEGVARLCELPLAFQPGESWCYGAEAIMVLGHVLEKAAGIPLGVLLRQCIFEPLGMADTGFFCPPGQAERLVEHYWHDGAAGLRVGTDHDHDWLAPPPLENGGAGLVSTAGDFSRFCRMLLGGGSLDGVRILSPKSVAMLRVNTLPGNRDMAQLGVPGLYDGWLGEGLGISLCAGTTIDRGRRLLPGSLGDITWGGAANTCFIADPAEDLSLVFMTQVMGAPFFFTLQRLVFTAVYGAMTESFA